MTVRATLFVPVLNELDGLKLIMPTIPAGLFEQILIIDGNSTDGSAEWAREQGYDVYIQKGPGLKNAYTEGWSLIRNEYVVTFSPDGNCKTEDLPLLLRKLEEGYDMVIASRYKAPAKSEDDDPVTGFGNWLFTTTINLLHGGGYTDAMTIYRAYRTRFFTELGLDRDDAYAMQKFFLTRIGVEPLLSVRAAKRKLRITEIPSDEPKRLTGERKLQIVRWGLAYMTQVLRETYYWK